MSVIRLHGNEVSFQVDGEAGRPCLMFSNSLGTNLHMWDAQAEFLRRDFRIIRYDTRGHGGSSTVPGSASLAQLGQDVLALLDALDVERTHFCGLSMGGAIAQWLGIHAPQRLNKLVIANSAPRIGTPQGWQDRAAQVRAAGLDAVADGAAGRWFTPGYIQREPQQVASLVAFLRGGSAEGYASCCDALADADLRGHLQSIAAPTLLVAGAHDPVTTVADAAAILEQIPRATMVTLEASHISNIEAEAGFNLALKEFLHR
ncbi:3-oxoadipate enol-lactonase [Duganella violaceipulchra]|uniref:3-oxoadipate enol-lactonase n=1 Tax=Duganella violaceipulchra TaxID=2849652 RepID=A0AA41H4B5_9BURK|nr:3-oxoadipate enol-lactonase [Duganella violaceicalia]MBV6319350.1 3-oxoadipate enol-lactonase [Duganella violaceicalia]MCP2006838.1 3-oxoadipate enol-lactonase [Duganella violaceicalia]